MTDNAPAETAAPHNLQSRKLRLQSLPVTSIPPHPSLADLQTTSAVPVVPFMAEVLNEALTFTDTLMHTQFRTKNKPTTSPPSTAPVQLLTFAMTEPATSKPESWFGRRSVHEDKAEKGTATWAEFEGGLFDNHSVNEGKYTPGVFDARHLFSYGVEEGLDSLALKEKGWEDVHAEVFEMGHRIPTPLANRVFSVLVVRGKISAERPGMDGVENANGFVTAQIPVDLAKTKTAFYANSRNRSEGGSTEEKGKVVMGEYASVERCRRQGEGKIVWEMATASDAKGNLPTALQKLGIPGAIIKDVGLFLKWVHEERRG